MLSRLFISNYALIGDLTVNFEPGLNIITGETGAGKSIILGALSLIMGARADISNVRGKEEKCVVEGTFDVEKLNIKHFFTSNDLDYDNNTILRRELLSSGKSRAFINDTPVNLNLLKNLSQQLIDIHSQHQNLELNNQHFQLRIVDIVSKSRETLEEYALAFDKHSKISAQLKSLSDEAKKTKSDLDYYEFQYRQLSEAKLEAGEQPMLEEEREKLVHSEEITQAFAGVTQLLDGEHFPVLQQLKEALNHISKIRNFAPQANEFLERITSVHVELQDLAHESEYLAANNAFDPARLQQINDRLDLLYSLQQKHHVQSTDELITIRDQYGEKMNRIEDYDNKIAQLDKQRQESLQQLTIAVNKLTLRRKTAFPVICQKVVEVLTQLGIPHAVFEIEHRSRENFTPDGADAIRFLFSANKNVAADDISRFASGGEISRVMLALKTLVSDSRMLPTVVFDEIDSGISGETALRMGSILKNMSLGMQIINITHLPQIASRGDHHYKVFKSENDEGSYTSIRKLDREEKIEELAVMVGGSNHSETARKTAIELLEGKQ
ncbi:MAG: DNA repair protein RecN [Prolixibacteraceae bacterium]|nr:DNA repair protein RecN [Prolixibacteraceae bacterium]